MTYTVRPRPGIENITPYQGGESKLKGIERVIKLASNEGPFGPSPKAVEAAQKAAQTMHRYPDGGAVDLRAALADKHGLNADRIVCGAGSDELLSLLCFAYTGPGDEVLFPEHGFLMYAISAFAAGATPVKAAETNLTTDVDALLGAVTDKTRIVFLANPNNPTGTYISGAELKRLRDGLPEHVLLVVDAAYAEYVVRGDYSPGRELVDAGQNTVMTRTFSKMYALGGMRVGWAYAPEEVADVLNRVRGPFNVTSAGQAAALGSLNDPGFEERSREYNLDAIPKVQAKLHDLGIDTTDSVANFVLARFADAPRAEACDGFLRERGIIVRRMAGYGLPESLRVTLGAEDEMDAFFDAMKAFQET